MMEETIEFDKPIPVKDFLDWKFAVEMCYGNITELMIKQSFCPKQLDYSVYRFQKIMDCLPKMSIR